SSRQATILRSRERCRASSWLRASASPWLACRSSSSVSGLVGVMCGPLLVPLQPAAKGYSPRLGSIGSVLRRAATDRAAPYRLSSRRHPHGRQQASVPRTGLGPPARSAVPCHPCGEGTNAGQPLNQQGVSSRHRGARRQGGSVRPLALRCPKAATVAVG